MIGDRLFEELRKSNEASSTLRPVFERPAKRPEHRRPIRRLPGRGERLNLKIVKTYADRAKSGASMFERDQLRDLMVAAKAGEFDVVVVEGLDRLSRDQADMAGIYKRLKFWDVTI